MNFDYSVLENEEKIIYMLRSLYSKRGFVQYKMSKFEEYDFYVKNKDFLFSDKIITFTDTNGRLMAMKPDVTLSIVRNSKDEPGLVQKMYYNENVYRAEGDGEPFKEIMQLGLECIGDLRSDNIIEVIELAGESLLALSKDSILEISHAGLLTGIIGKLEISDSVKEDIYKAVNEKNPHLLKEACDAGNVDLNTYNALNEMLTLYGKPSEALAKLTDILKNYGLLSNSELGDALCELKDVTLSFENTPINDILRIDFSVLSDTKYYNNIVFTGFINGIPDRILSGGQYDKLMRKVGRNSRAIGFAVYLNVLERLNAGSDEGAEKSLFEKQFIIPGKTAPSRKFLNVALPKGRLGERVYEMFARSGFECPSILENNRKLIFENDEVGVRYFWAKPSDVSIYVERGAADIGVAGKDILLEYNPDIYELLDLNIGKCRMCVAGPKTFIDDPSKTLRVATKFSNIARSYYASKDRDIDIVHLNGSIEIAPILGLTDVIVDIVETGTTLKENDLHVIETIVPISARLIANRSSYKFNSEQIKYIKKQLSMMVNE